MNAKINTTRRNACCGPGCKSCIIWCVRGALRCSITFWWHNRSNLKRVTLISAKVLASCLKISVRGIKYVCRFWLKRRRLGSSRISWCPHLKHWQVILRAKHSPKIIKITPKSLVTISFCCCLLHVRRCTSLSMVLMNVINCFTELS